MGKPKQGTQGGGRTRGRARGPTNVEQDEERVSSGSFGRSIRKQRSRRERVVNATASTTDGHYGRASMPTVTKIQASHASGWIGKGDRPEGWHPVTVSGSGLEGWMRRCGL